MVSASLALIAAPTYPSTSHPHQNTTSAHPNHPQNLTRAPAHGTLPPRRSPRAGHPGWPDAPARAPKSRAGPAKAQSCEELQRSGVVPWPFLGENRLGASCRKGKEKGRKGGEDMLRLLEHHGLRDPPVEAVL